MNKLAKEESKGSEAEYRKTVAEMNARAGLSKNPKFGKTTRELVNLIQGEPDPTLFQPPADYLVVNKRLPSSPCPTAGLVATPHHPDAPPPSAQ